jgi:probable rRNA maturation factor
LNCEIIGRIDAMPRSAATSTVIEIHQTPGVARRLKMSWLRDHLRLIAGKIKHPLARIGVSLTDDEGMIRLHHQYLGLTTTTDVLTFSNSAEGHPIDVDIAACVDEAARQAAKHQHSIEQEILLYILHGLLHCCGFDDHTKAGYAKMHAEEDRILKAVGVGATFSKPAPAARTRRRSRARR